MNKMSRPTTVEQVFEDYKARRGAILRALTTDFEEFHKQCDPGKEDLCLYGQSDGSWVVSPPAKFLPTTLPEPVLGLNSARDVWISYVASHSGAWLVSVAFWHASRIGLDKAARERLFNMINNLPTVYEAVQSDNNEMSNSIVPKKRVAGLEGKCGICKRGYKEDEFWICCGTCDTWFHAECVKITPLMSERIMYYKSPPCSKGKKARS